MALRDFKLKRLGLLFFNLGGIMKTKTVDWIGVLMLGLILGAMVGLGF
jgi:hypothetical protein